MKASERIPDATRGHGRGVFSQPPPPYTAAHKSAVVTIVKRTASIQRPPRRDQNASKNPGMSTATAAASQTSTKMAFWPG